MPHSHVDLAWYWTRQETRRLLQRIFGQALLPLMDRDPDFRFTQDQALLFEELKAVLPTDAWERLRSFVAQGRLEPAGGMLVQPEFAEPCGESIVRQLSFGQRLFESTIGRRATCLWNIDSFGQTAQLPQLALKSGMRRMVFMRGMPDGEIAERMPTEFWLTGPDGSRVLAHWMAGTYFIGRRGPLAAKLALLAAKAATRSILLPYGGDLYRHRQSARAVAAQVRRAAKEAGLGRVWIRTSTASEFLDAVEADGASLDSHAPDLAVPLHLQDLRGTFVNRIGLKQENRRAERALLAAETLAALTGDDGDGLDPLWKELLSCQFHDVIGGSCTDAVHFDAMDRVARTGAAAVEFLERRLGARSGGLQLAVVHPAGRSLRLIEADVAFPEGAGVEGLSVAGPDGPCECETAPAARHADGTLARATVRFSAQLPPYSVRRFRLVPANGEPDRPPPAGEGFIENGLLRVEVDATTGDLARILHLSSGRDLIDGSGNELCIEEEDVPDMEGRLGTVLRTAVDRDAPPESIRSGASQAGAWISVVKRFEGCRVEKEIRLVAGEDLVRFTTTLDVLDRRNRLVWAEFRVRGAGVPVHDVPFATLERPDGLFPVQHGAGFDVEGGIVSLLNQGTCGCRTSCGRVEIALLRGFADFRGYQSMRDGNGFRGDGAGSCVAAAELGRHVFRYALAFRKTRSEAAAAGHAYNREPIAVQCLEAPEIDLLAETSERFLVTAVKPSAGGAVAIRGFESEGTGGDVFLKFTEDIASCEAVSLLEDEAETLTPGKRIGFKVAPFGIATFRVVPIARNAFTGRA